MAGFIMLLAFTGAVLDRQRTRYGFFVMGAGISLGAFTARYISFRRRKAVRELPVTGHVTV